MWNVEYTDEFEYWWNQLTEVEQIDIAAVVDLLEQLGPDLRFPHSSGIKAAHYSHMRELRIQHRGNPYRILYAFDPRRTAILLLGENKAGKAHWYERMISKADKLYAEHLKSLELEQV